MIAEFVVTIIYGQILVEAPGLPPAALRWDDAHVDQGFAWSPGRVAFGVDDSDGDSLLRVSVAPDYMLSDEVLWAVQVPFDVPAGSLSIGDVLLPASVDIPAGRYGLVFSAQSGGGRERPGGAAEDEDGLPDSSAPEPLAYVLDLIFVPATEPDFAILRQGELASASVTRRDTDLIPVPGGAAR